MKKNTYEKLQENVKDLKFGEIDVWENKYPEKDYVVRLSTREFTCICPKTGLPDFARIYIEYSPNKLCIELKSFKEYLTAYRDIGIFHEHAVNRILDDIVRSCAPRKMRVKGIFNVRGGITTSVEAEYSSLSRRE
ncbi:MAG: preQ(1) synthase [Candidatus Omnitrophica bacterium]|nr:preQ(1) synthase [Candidatus Omnitrophota bacterium]MBU1127828.1 preQ(1) synthase [Candidatus Omnitrophota bacterium]MBU1657298.1 preQ(1) synthase [Candidatus Omnitrophota bacterium]MBU1783722.1 preQ(1) synthase [Candidatus Omnitrophota bacterium]MBU1851175.1 preQ(1) synthase [Candidatus Omnitrophota bacterium]